jgi:predicted enzyme related to lactoylglutathione lyase
MLNCVQRGGDSRTGGKQMKVSDVYVPVRVHGGELERCLSFYENILGERCQLRFDYSERSLELASVGAVLLMAGSETALAAGPAMIGTFAVDSLDEFRQELIRQGAAIIREPGDTPTGRNLFAAHPDGAIFEYMQFDSEKAAAVNRVNSR